MIAQRMDGLMTEEITPEVFEHLVALAAFTFDPAEAEYLRRELNSQLRAIRNLEAVPLDAGVPLAAHGVTYTPETSPPLREDVWEPCDNAGEIMSQVPQVEDGFIIVPDIPLTELE